MGEFEGPDFVGVIEYRYGKSPDPIHSHFFYAIV